MNDLDFDASQESSESNVAKGDFFVCNGSCQEIEVQVEANTKISSGSEQEDKVAISDYGFDEASHNSFLSNNLREEEEIEQYYEEEYEYENEYSSSTESCDNGTEILVPSYSLRSPFVSTIEECVDYQKLLAKDQEHEPASVANERPVFDNEILEAILYLAVQAQEQYESYFEALMKLEIQEEICYKCTWPSKQAYKRVIPLFQQEISDQVVYNHEVEFQKYKRVMKTVFTSISSETVIYKAESSAKEQYERPEGYIFDELVFAVIEYPRCYSEGQYVKLDPECPPLTSNNNISDTEIAESSSAASKGNKEILTNNYHQTAEDELPTQTKELHEEEGTGLAKEKKKKSIRKKSTEPCGELRTLRTEDRPAAEAPHCPDSRVHLAGEQAAHASEQLTLGSSNAAPDQPPAQELHAERPEACMAALCPESATHSVELQPLDVRAGAVGQLTDGFQFVSPMARMMQKRTAIALEAPTHRTNSELAGPSAGSHRSGRVALHYYAQSCSGAERETDFVQHNIYTLEQSQRAVLARLAQLPPKVVGKRAVLGALRRTGGDEYYSPTELANQLISEKFQFQLRADRSTSTTDLQGAE